MGIKLHNQETTTPKIHADFLSSSFQHYGEKISLVSLGISVSTIQRWRYKKPAANRGQDRNTGRR